MRSGTLAPHVVLDFWLTEVGPKKWYQGSDALDSAIREKFHAAWADARDQGSAPWQDGPQATLASLILLDQFPRNMFRDQAGAFSTDRLALRVARVAIDRDDPAQVASPAKQFFFLPFSHSESLQDQDEGIKHLIQHMPGSPTLLHAKAHRQVISDFGRFPFRNKALGRTSSAAECAFMDEGGYPALVRKMGGEGAS